MHIEGRVKREKIRWKKLDARNSKSAVVWGASASCLKLSFDDLECLTQFRGRVGAMFMYACVRVFVCGCVCVCVRLCCVLWEKEREGELAHLTIVDVNVACEVVGSEW